MGYEHLLPIFTNSLWKIRERIAKQLSLHTLNLSSITTVDNIAEHTFEALKVRSILCNFRALIPNNGISFALSALAGDTYFKLSKFH